MSEVVQQQVDALDRAERPVVIGGLVSRLRAVVPVDDLPVRRVDPLRVILERHEPAPLLLAGAVDRQVLVDVGGSDWNEPAREHADVLVVHIERVERLRRQVRGPEEIVDVVNLAVCELVIEEQVEHVLSVARALA